MIFAQFLQNAKWFMLCFIFSIFVKQIYFEVLSNDDDPYYHEQLSYGKKFNTETDYFVFRTRSVAVEFLVGFMRIHF